MAELAVVGLLLSTATTAVNILALIKRRCGALAHISELTDKCADVVRSINNLLHTIQIPRAAPESHTRSLRTALEQRSFDFHIVQDALCAVRRQVENASRVKLFVLAQGVARNLGSIYNDLDSLRAGVERVALHSDSWRAGSGHRTDVVLSDEISLSCASSSSLNRKECTFLDLPQLTSKDMQILVKHGEIAERTLPEALFKACAGLETTRHMLKRAGDTAVLGRTERRMIRFLHIAARLGNSKAHRQLGWRYYDGNVVGRDYQASVVHYKVACAAGLVDALRGIWNAYKGMNRTHKAVKYIRTAAEHGQRWAAVEMAVRYAQGNGMPIDNEQAALCVRRVRDPMFHSLAHFSGIGVLQSEACALNVFRRLEVEQTQLVTIHVSQRATLHVRYKRPRTWKIVASLNNETSSAETRCLIRKWLEFLAKSGVRTAALMSYASRTDQAWIPYFSRVAADGFVPAHIVLASYWSHGRDAYRARTHLHIAANAGRNDAGAACRQLYTADWGVQRGVAQPDEEPEQQRRERQLRPGKRSLQRRSHASLGDFQSIGSCVIDVT